MSLRAEIRDAIDDVIPPAPTLERAVTAYVFADRRDRKVLTIRRRRAPWTRTTFRGGAALAAALLVVALIAGLVLGGRILRDLHSTPAPAINQGELKRLEARPLLPLPAMPSDGVCPAGPVAENFMGGFATGDGPMRLILGYPVTTFRTSWGTWTQTYFLVSPTTNGLFLVRGRDLKSGATVYFAGNLSGIADAQFGRAILGGKTAGQDQVNGQRADLHPELVINASAPSDFVKTPNKPPLWGAYVGYSSLTSGCISFQVDYDNSSEPFVYGY
jgi:hypothetical protein